MIRRQSMARGLQAFGLWRISWNGLCDGKFTPKTLLQTDFPSKRRMKRMPLWPAVSQARWRSFSTKSLNRRLGGASGSVGGLEPHFRVLFSAIFQGFTRENFYQGRN